MLPIDILRWQFNGDSYSPLCHYGKIMVWPSWKIALSSRGHHGICYNVILQLIIQPTLLISALVVLRLFFKAEYVERNHEKLPIKWNIRLTLCLQTAESGKLNELDCGNQTASSSYSTIVYNIYINILQLFVFLVILNFWGILFS